MGGAATQLFPLRPEMRSGPDMSEKDRLTPRQHAFCDEYLLDLNARQAAIARATLRFLNNFLRFLNDFEPRTCGPFSRYPARIAKDLTSARNESRPTKTMCCVYLRRTSSARCSVLRFNIVPTQTRRKPRSRAKCYGLLITPYREHVVPSPNILRGPKKNGGNREGK